MTGHWTRDDFRMLDVHPMSTPTTVLDKVARYLNEHYPKPQPVGNGGRSPDWMHKVAPEMARVEHDLRRRLAVAERNREDALGAYGKAARERDEAKERAEQAERERDEQLVPAYAMLDVWMALGHDSTHFDDWYDGAGYADAWAEVTAAVRKAAEARPAPAVTRDDVEQAIREHASPRANEAVVKDATNDVWALISGDDPAAMVVRESEMPSAHRLDSGAWQSDRRACGQGSTAAGMRELAGIYMADAARFEAIARAIEAEAAPDPAEELAGQIEDATREAVRAACDTLNLLTPRIDPRTVEQMLEITETSRRVARHVLGQEGDDE